MLNGDMSNEAFDDLRRGMGPKGGHYSVRIDEAVSRAPPSAHRECASATGRHTTGRMKASTTPIVRKRLRSGSLEECAACENKPRVLGK